MTEFRMSEANAKVLLQYPGGKFRARKQLEAYIPEDVKSICSPFFGGGSFETYLNVKREIKIEGYDGFDLLVNFWQCAILDGTKLADHAEKYYPPDLETFRLIRSELESHSLPLDFEAAAKFFFVNRASFSGRTVSKVGWSPKNFTKGNLEKLRTFEVQDLTVECRSFEESVPNNNSDLLYVDPPYMLDKGNDLYGRNGDLHKSFNHERLAELLLNTSQRFVLSYNDCDGVRDLYSGLNIHEEMWAYGMNHSKNLKGKPELVITNFDTRQSGVW